MAAREGFVHPEFLIQADTLEQPECHWGESIKTVLKINRKIMARRGPRLLFSISLSQ